MEESKTKIVGGLDISSVVDGGTVFEVNNELENVDEIKQLEEECSQALQNYLKLECLDFGKSYDGTEPFTSLAQRMQNLLQNGKVKKRVIREGYGAQPEQNSHVNIHYNAYVQNEAEPFDSTYVRKQPFTFKLGQGEVIQGLEIAVSSMKLNEKSEFLIEPELAYRSGGLGRIPPNAQVLFEVVLCEVKEMVHENGKEPNEKYFEVVYPKCLALCVQGKKMFRLKDFNGAIKVYTTAVNNLEAALLNDYDDQLKSEELLVRLYTNLLICYTHLEIPKKGCMMAQHIYELAKNETFKVSAKVFFNHAKCKRMLGAFDQAYRTLSQARSLEPNNKEIKEEFDVLKEAKRKFRQHENDLAAALVHS